MYANCDTCEEDPNGSKAVTLIGRLLTLLLALSSAVTMAAASECTVVDLAGAATYTVSVSQYPSFVFLVCFNIVVAVIEAGAIYVQLVKDGGEDDGGKLAQMLAIADAAVQAMLYLSTGAAFGAAYPRGGGQVGGACAAFGRQVIVTKVLSLFASFSISVAVIAKDVVFPFSVWPRKPPKIFFF